MNYRGNHRPTLRQVVGVGASLTALASVVGLVLLAMPHAPSPSSSDNRSSNSKQSALASPGAARVNFAGAATVASGTAAPTDTPLPGATATPTDTPPASQPTATATPPPTPTATPAPPPAWHVFTTFSGTGEQQLGTVNLAQPWRLTYTCGPLPQQSSWDFLTPYPRDGRTDYPVALCQGSGEVNDGMGWPAAAGTYNLSVMAANPSVGVGAWTLTVEEWY